MRPTSAADTRNVTAFTTYGTVGPHAVTMRPATMGPIIHDSVSTVTTSELALTSSSSGTRFGIAGVCGRQEEAGRDARDRSQHHEPAHTVHERQRREHSEAHEVGDDHQPSPREAVEERAEEEPDDDDREEVRDQERCDPDAGLGFVVDLKR